MDKNSQIALTKVSKKNESYFAPLMPRYLQKCWQKPDYVVIGVIWEGAAAAVLLMKLYEDRGDIQWLYTIPAARRLGLAETMLQHIIIRAKETRIQSLSIAYSGADSHGLFEKLLSKFHFQIQTELVPRYSMPLSDIEHAPIMNHTGEFHVVGEKICHFSEISDEHFKTLRNQLASKGLNFDSDLQNEYLDPSLSMAWFVNDEVKGFFLISRPLEKEIQIDLLYQMQSSPRAMLFMMIHSALELKKLNMKEGVLRLCALNEQAQILIARLLNLEEAEQFYFYYGFMDLDDWGLSK